MQIESEALGAADVISSYEIPLVSSLPFFPPNHSQKGLQCHFERLPKIPSFRECV